MTEPESPPAPVRVHHLAVVRTARYVTVGGPSGDAPLDVPHDAASQPTPVRAVWLALHGYGQLAEYFARPFARHAAGRLIVAPEALSRFYLPAAGGRSADAHAAARVGATWMTREDRAAEIDDYVRYLDHVLDTAAAAAGVDVGHVPLGVLGFSQGAATACRWAVHRHGRLGQATGGPAPARVVLWGGGVPPDVDLGGVGGDALRAARLTLVAGDADEFATSVVLAREEARLRDAGVPYSVVRYAGGHRVDADTLGAVLAG